MDSAAAGHPEVVGNKFAGLARLKSWGYMVPPAYVIPAHVVSRIRPRSPDSEALLTAVIKETWSLLNVVRGIAVRSSGLAEDNSQVSGAGRFRTVLNVCGDAQLRDAIRYVLEGFGQGGDLAERAGAVILQEMVHPDAAGVVFSRHPVRVSEDLVVVEAGKGLADRVVSGDIPGYRVVLTADREPAPILGEDGTCIVDAAALIRLRAVARSIEASMAGPVDIEWAISGDELFLLQARPALALSESRPRGTWTRAIAEDLWGDELCVVDASIIMSLAPRFDLKPYARRLGLAIDENAPSMAVIEGHLFVNGDLLSDVLGQLPRSVGKWIAERVLPLGRVPDRFAGSWTMLARIAAMALSDSAANPVLCPRVTRKKIRSILFRLEQAKREAVPDLRGAADALKLLLRLHGELLESNQMPYLLTFLFVSLAGEGLAGRGGGDNPTTRLYRRMEHLAAAIRDRGCSIPDEAPLPPDLAEQFDELIAEYGAKSDVRSLASRRWREEPEKVLSLLRAMGKASRAELDSRTNHARTLRTVVFSRLAGWYLDLREDLRDALDRILDAERQYLLRIDAAIGGREMVFDWTLPDILGLAEQGGQRAAAPLPYGVISRSQKKKSAFPPRFLVDGEAVDADLDGAVVRGIPVSPGRVRGKSRHVDSLAQAMRSEDGEILIAWTMGPSWAPVLSKAAGIILAEGGMLSHFSIIAREQRVPCVVGAGKAVLEIPNGTDAMIDGYEGTIRVGN